MKYLLIILVIVSFSSSAQQCIILKKDGSSLDTFVQATSDSQLFTKDGNFNYSDIHYIDFGQEGVVSESTVKKLVTSGVSVFVNGEKFDGDITSPIVLKPRKNKDLTLEGTVTSIEKFRQQRNLGKGLQLAGLLATIIYTAQAGDVSEFKPGLYYASACAISIGFIIDIDAGRHLRLSN